MAFAKILLFLSCCAGAYGATEYAITVSENLPIGRILFVFNSSDAGSPLTGNVQYTPFILDSNLFTLDSNTGVLSLIGFLDRGTSTIHAIVVNIKDQSTKSVNVTLTVNVANTEDLNPVYAKSVYTYNVLEGTDGYLTTIIATNNNGSALNNIVYSLVDPANSGIITYNSNNGSISIKSNGATDTIDREADSYHEFLLVATEISGNERRQGSALLSLNVLDVNDNPPVFTTPDTNAITIAEEIVVATSIFQFSAEDGDISSTVSYKAANPTHADWNKFHLNSTTGSITTNAKFDYDQQQSFALIVYAVDDGNKVSTKNISLIVTVAKPSSNLVFELSRYVYNENEHNFIFFPLGGIGTPRPVKATPQLPTLRYYIRSGTQDPNAAYFFVEDTTGNVRINTELDYETKRFYSFIVDAVDTNGTYKNGSTLVEVNVLDIIDITPKLYILDDNKSVSVNENTDVGQIVAFFFVEDIDTETTKPNGLLYSKTSVQHLPFKFMIVNSTMALLLLTEPLNREVTPFYQLQVQVRDALQYKSNIINLNITVTDANDMNPTFSMQRYYFEIIDNAAVGTVVGQVFAKDNDTGNHAMLMYSLYDPMNNNFFSINSTTGVITVSNSLNVTKNTTYTYKVIAKDMGLSPREGSALIQIYVGRSVNLPPAPSQLTVNLTISEKFQLNELVYRLFASDFEDHPFEFKYSRTLLQNPDQEMFTLNNDGSIYLKQTLPRPNDRERQSSYTLYVVAEEIVSGLQSAEITVNIAVSDINDNSPKFTQSIYNFNVDENSLFGTVVGMVHAYDNDSTQANNKIQYSMVSSGNIFAVNESTGYITIIGNLDREDQPEYFYSVIASDKANDNDESFPSQEARIGVTQVKITVNDLNDNYPIFSAEDYVISISEKVPVGRDLFTFSATDLDTGNFGEIMYKVISMDSNLFKLNSSTGVISVIGPLNYENAILHQIVVYAEDMGGMKSKNVSLTINVVDVNDENPLFTQNIYIMNVTEGTDGYLTTITATDADGTTTNKNLVYSLIDPSNSDVITYNSTNGKITIKANGITNTLDREQVAKYEFLLIATDMASDSRKGSAILILNLIDENDNLPVFSTPTSDAITVTEGVPLGTSIYQFRAVDQDVTDVVNYEAADQTNSDWHIFELERTTGILKTRGFPDFSLKASYMLEVKAVDQDNKASLQNAFLNITVLDTVNGTVGVNKLIFTQNRYQISQDENVFISFFPIGSILNPFKVTAIPDFNVPSTIRYYMRDGSSEASQNFRIDENDGKVYLKQKLDYETKQYYAFEVVAMDTSKQLQNGTALVVVDVIDVIDVTPVLNLFHSTSVIEDISIGQIVAVIFTDDIDTETIKTNGLIYGLETNENITLPFNIIASPNQIYAYILVTGQLDREQKEVYQMNITVKDALGYTATPLPINITVLDANDNKPIFEKPNGYVFPVHETNATFTNISTVKATDADSTTINSDIRYSIIHGPDSADVIIDPITGMISVNNSIDYETIKFIDFTVVAMDTATPDSNKRKSCVPVRITVVDENDNYPEYTGQDNFYLQECAPVGSLVGRLTASDKDSDKFGVTNFQFAIFENTFLLTPDGSLIIFSSSSLDYETKSEYYFNITISDDGGLKVLQEIKVTLQNCNDVRPVFNSSNYMANVSEDAAISSVIATVIATDEDKGTFNKVSYEIVNPFYSTSEIFPFIINQTTGEISNTRLLDYEARSFYQFMVRALDNGTPTLTNVTYVIINVIDENDNPPVFTEQCYNVTISDATVIGGTVLIVTAMDKDNGQNGNVLYSLDDSSGDFMIDNMTGAVTVAKTLNYNQRKRYQLNLFAMDQGNPQMNDTSKIIIDLTAMKNFPTTVADIFINENVAVFGKVLSIPDVLVLPGDRSPMVYSIEFFNTTNSSSFFSINSTTGEVSILRDLDYEEMKWHVFLRKVMFDGDVIGEQTVFVRVRDDNDNAPYFIASSRQQVVNISESSEVGQIVAVLVAMDQDTAPPLMYSISTASDKFAFVVQSDTLVLHLVKELDAEMERQISVIVNVSDGLYSVAENVIVNVIDENDHSPMFHPMQYVFYKRESQSADTFIGTVFANDSDITAVQNTVRYRIMELEAQTMFNIDPMNGTITSRTVVDYETQNMYNFTVEAYNMDAQGIATRAGVALVTVHVIDVNDNPPVCYGTITYNFYENTPIGTILFYVNSTDKDGGENGRLTYTAVTGTSTGIAVNLNTGSVQITEELDFESSKFKLVAVKVSDNGNTSLSCQQIYFINILDSNDNKPVFTIRPNNKYIASIPENSPLATSVIQTFAIDGDSGLNSVLNYSIAASYGNLPFNISSDGLIMTSETLDREQKDFYQFFIQATDNGLPNLSDTILVEVTITDKNDNSPVFNQLLYNITIPEGTPTGFSLLQVQATDPDDGTFGQIKYILESGDSFGLFRLDNKTGALYTNDKVLTSTYPNLSYQIAVNASDCDEMDPRYSQQNVIINIRVVQYTSPAPVFITDYVTFRIFEKIESGVIGQTIALGSEVTYYIVYDDKRRPEIRNFIILKKSGHIFLIGNNTLDYEVSKGLSFTVRAMNKFGVNATQNVFIIIGDLDDNPPFWTSPQNQSVVISDETRVGQIVATATAFDIDTVSQNKLSFNLKDDFSGTFNVLTDQDVAVIVVNKDLRTLQTDYVLCLDVTDPAGSKANQSSFITVAVRQTPLPQLPSIYTFTAIENTSQIIVGTVQATGVSNPRYTLLTASGEVTSDGVFSINTTSGQIRVLTVLDREVNDKYVLSVIVREAGSNRYATTRVLVTVIDINDNRPIFHSPSVYNFTEVFPQDSLLFKLRATDADVLNNGKIRYSFVSSSQPINLMVDPTSGMVTYISGMNFEVADVYTIIFKAEDYGAPKNLSTLQTVRINIVGVNEFSPVFSQPIYNAILSENTLAFDAPLQVRATDADSGPAGVVTYSLRSPYAITPFQIDQNTGIISVFATVDREKTDSYELMVIASDNGVEIRRSAALVHIQVRDVNDNAPVFYPSVYRLTISDATPIGADLAGIFATDIDLSNNTLISYNIFDGNTLQKFDINQTSGVLYLKNALNYTNTIERSFVLRVNAISGNLLTSNTPATVYIQVVQSPIPAPPYFVQDTVALSIFEDSETFNVLFGNTAVNPSGGSMTFSIVNNTKVPDEDMFMVTKKSGSVLLKSQLDYETLQVHNFLVKVTCNTSGLAAYQSVQVVVKDINDNRPYFLNNGSKTVTINERTNPGQEITFIPANDPDSINQNDLFFKIQTPNVPFYIVSNGNNGIVYVKSELRHNIQSLYHLEITVFDKQRNGNLQNEALHHFNLTVNVTKNNELTPVFEAPLYIVDVKENNEVPSFLITTRASHADKYEILTSTTFFQMSQSGVLLARRSFDAEVDRHYEISIMAINLANNRTGYTVVRINVENINDITPNFISPYNYSVFENLPIGSRLFSVIVNDSDVVTTSKTFRIVSVIPAVSIVISENGDVFLSGPLNYETAKKHVVEIVVTDNGIPKINNTQKYTVNVINENDNDPIFNPDSETVEVEENSLPNTLSRSTATDKDAGVYGQVTYSLISLFPVPFIATSQGSLFLNGPVDYESVKSYDILMQAKDGGIPPRIGFKKYRILVRDTNDNIPVFETPLYNVTVAEIAPIGMSLVTVRAYDIDTSPYNVVNYKITSGNSGNTFRIDSAIGVISTNTPLDREVLGYYELEVSAEDKNKPNPTTANKAKVRINIIDINEAGPTFTKPHQKIEILESEPIFSVIGAATAVDSDASYNLSTYTIQPNDDSDAFRINGTSGRIQLVTELNYEIKKSYYITLIATDNGGLKGYQSVEVAILDVNDEVPSFINLVNQTYVIKQDISPIQIIGMLSGYDPDSVSKNKLSMSIINSANQLFDIKTEGDIGYITVKNGVNLGVMTYILEVSVTDGKYTSSQNAYVTITVNTPSIDYAEIVFVQQPGYTFNVYENKTSHVFGQIQAKIKDNISSITYRIYETNIPFAIDRNTGLLQLSGLAPRNIGGPDDALDYEKQTFFLFHVAAEVSINSIQYTALTSVMVIVLDVNDNPPIFHGNTTFKVQENILIGSEIFTVSASDADSGESGRITYSINSLLFGSNRFSINPNTGALSVVQPLDYDEVNNTEYTIQVIARDNGKPSLSTSQVYSIQVLNVNDNGPQFPLNLYTLSISEGEKNQKNLKCIKAEDKDTSDQLSYQLLFGDASDNEKFAVSQNTGCIIYRGNSALDRETKARYTFILIAFDSGSPPLSGYTNIVVDITDVNDNVPLFANSQYNLQIADVTAINSTVIRLIATDPDDGANGIVTFAITSGNTGNAFRINPDGTLVTSVTFINSSLPMFYQLQILAMDGGTPQTSSTIQVSVQIINTVTANLPKFTSTEYNQTIPETYDVAKAILIVSANVLGGSVVYEILDTSVRTSGKFAINAQGVITLLSKIDYEEVQAANFLVKASPASNPNGDFATAFVNIQITDVNDERPVFETAILQNSLARNSRNGTVVAIVKANDRDSGTNGVVNYQFEPNFSSSLFAVNQFSGEVTLIRQISFADVRNYQLSVMAYDSGIPQKQSTASAKVKVNIYPDNMHAPVFQNIPSLSRTVQENTPTESTIVRVLATDEDSKLPSESIAERPDARNFGQVSYSLLQTAQILPFTITAQGDIVVSSPIDRELKGLYEFYVQASDGGSPPRKTTQKVSFTVGDVNEKPVFLSQIYDIKVSEITPIGTSVFQVSAIDNDLGVNGQLSYALASGGGGKFNVNPSNGKIMLTDFLDYEKQSQYNLILTATDSGTPPLSANAQVNVTVAVAYNSSRPVFKLSKYEFVDVVESSSFQVLGDVEATRVGVAGSVIYEIQPVLDSSFFVVNKDTGRLIFTAADFENKTIYDAVVKAYNAERPQLYSKATIRVYLKDKNDNTPILYTNNVNVRVDENTEVGQVVTILYGEDKDSGLNGKLVYSFVQASNAFSIKTINKTGVIKLERPLDRETISSYTLNVKLEDSAPQPQRLTAPLGTVIVTVNDENDNNPLPRNNIFAESITIQRNTPVNTTVFTAFFSDKDTGLNGLVEYTLVAASINNPPFTVQSNGAVLVSSFIPTDDEYLLYLSARDKGSPLRQTPFTLKITIAGNQTSSPYFSPGTYTLMVDEAILVDTAIGKLNAIDPDGGNNLLVFKIESGNTNGDFRVNNNGNIVVNKPLDRETTSQYVLAVSVTDNNGNGLKSSSNAVVTIDVKDLNDNNPVFSQTSYSFSQSETFPKGNFTGPFIATVQATDRDEGTNGALNYRIIDSTNTFDINNDGKIWLKKDLDYHLLNRYNFVVIASDQGVARRQTPVNVVVDVLDVNEPPLFVPQTYNISVSEAVKADTSIVSLNVVDNDSGPNNNRVTLAIKSGNNDSVFILEGNVLKLKAVLDYEKIRSYTLKISVVDAGSPSLSATTDATVNINVVSVNDNQPIFTLSSYSASVDEGTIPAQPILEVTATDKDETSNIIYQLDESSDSTYFKITTNNGTGIISVLKPLDFELQPLYVFSVVANDKDNPSLQSKALVKVTAIDINDNVPIFQQFFYNFEIPDRTPEETIVGVIQAIDKDTNSQVEYFFPSNYPDSDHFKLRGNLLVLNKTVDYTTQKRYTFMVGSKDKQSQTIGSIANVTVNVQMSSGNPPTFEKAVLNVSVYDNVSVSDVIIQVHAVDQDGGNYGSITYSIIPSIDSPRFRINPTNGQVSLKVGQSLSYQQKRRLVIAVRATDAVGLYSEAYIVIHVMGNVIDTTRPTFVVPKYFAVASDRMSVGTSLVTVYAVDSQSHSLTYSIVSRNDPDLFILSPNGNLQLNKQITYNSSAPIQYTIVVRATDEAGLTSVSNAEIVVDIVYVTPETPVFAQSVYMVNYAENIAPSLVFTANATIPSAESQTNVRYKLQYNAKLTQNDFIINNVSGQVSAVRTFDRESRSQYVFQIIAYNNVQITSSDKALVIVSISDDNDNTPVFKVGSNTQQVTLNEQSPANIVVIDAGASDADLAENGKIIYRLLNTYNNLFRVDPNGLVRTNIAIDPLNGTQYTLEVVAQDQGSPVRSANLIVSVIIRKLNDASPQFSSNNYTVQVPETNVNLANIITVKATDNDSGTIKYSLAIPNQENIPFTIGTTTGVISSNAPLDFESQKRYELCVEASDSGSPALSSSTKVIIMITDVNDNPPLAQSMSYAANILESASIGQLVTIIKVTDKDSGRNGELLYSIINGNTGNAFQINNEGEVTVMNSLNRENIPSYTLRISVTDNGIVPQTIASPIIVSITVDDVNDNAPTVNPTSTTVNMNEGPSNRVVLQKISASDLDGDPVRFSIIDELESFTINEITGELKTKVAFNYNTRNRYTVTVRASDTVHSTFVVVIVNVVNTNVAPVITGSPYTFSVIENAVPGTFVGHVVANDGDSGPEGDLSYAFTPSSNDFSIDSNGNIKTLKIFDYDLAQQVFNLVVTVSDQGSPAKSTTGNVKINILNENDNNPSFIQTQYQAQANATGYVSLKVSASDADNNTLTYSLLPSSNSLLFNIDSTTGVITNVDPLSSPYYSLFASASDGSRHGNVLVTITVPNASVNGSCGVVTFSSPLYNVSKPEDLGVGQEIVQVKATLQTVGGVVTYNIEDQNSPFTVDVNGVVKTKQNLDYEANKVEEVCVSARSNQNPNIKAYATVRVYVQNVNDVKPVFENTPDITIYSQTPVSTVIGRVFASTPGFSVNYSLVFSGNEPFQIDSATGFISVSQTPTSNSYILRVRATSGTQTADQNVTIKVNTLSVNPPKFTKNDYNATIEENKAAGTSILTVSATDVDSTNLIYAIIDNSARQYFSIDENGVLKNTQPLDYESNRVHRFCIQVSDSVLIGVATVTITVKNLIDSKPVYLGDFSVIIPKDFSLRVVFLTAAATTEEGNKIVYSLIDYENNELFEINKQTGDLSLKKSPSSETARVKVTASNEFGESTVNVTVEFKQPSFLSSTVTVEEPQKKNETTVTITLDQEKFFGPSWNDVNTYDIVLYPIQDDGSIKLDLDICTPVQSAKTGCPYIALSGENKSVKRKRRAILNKNQKLLEVELGTDSSCIGNSDPYKACNSPLVAGKQYRIQLRGKTSSQISTFSKISTPIQPSKPVIQSEYTVETLADKSALNYYYISGLIVMAALLIICLAVIAVLMCFKQRLTKRNITDVLDHPRLTMQTSSASSGNLPVKSFKNPVAIENDYEAKPVFGLTEHHKQQSSTTTFQSPYEHGPRHGSLTREDEQELEVNLNDPLPEQTYFMKQHSGENAPVGSSRIYDNSDDPNPPSPPPASGNAVTPGGTTTQPRLTRTNSGRVILEHVFRQ